MLMELLSLYQWTLIAGCVAATGLALIGAQLSTRGQSAQTLVISQGSSLGVVMALSLEAWLGIDTSLTALLMSFFMASALYFICERRIRGSRPSRNSYYVGLFALLLSLTYTITALVPSLESHMAASYFGDLAVISNIEAQLILFLGAFVLIYLIWSWRKISSASFDTAVYGQTFRTQKDRWINNGFIILSLLLISASIQLMGLLFTLSALMLPSLAVGSRVRGLMPFTFSIASVASFASVAGVLLSLWHGKIPTVPAVAFSFVAFGILSRVVNRILNR